MWSLANRIYGYITERILYNSNPLQFLDLQSNKNVNEESFMDEAVMDFSDDNSMICEEVQQMNRKMN